MHFGFALIINRVINSTIGHGAGNSEGGAGLQAERAVADLSAQVGFAGQGQFAFRIQAESSRPRGLRADDADQVNAHPDLLPATDAAEAWAALIIERAVDIGAEIQEAA